MRLRVEFEPSLLSTAARRSGLQRAWLCAPAALRTVGDLAGALAARFGVNECSSDDLVLAASGFTLPSDAALCELLCDGDRVAVTRLQHGVCAPKRARTRSVDGGKGSDGDCDTSDGCELFPFGAAMPSLRQAPALYEQPSDVGVRSRSARRKALKRARRRELLNNADAGPALPWAVVTHAIPPVAVCDDLFEPRSVARDAAAARRAVMQPGPVNQSADKKCTTSDSRSHNADAAVRGIRHAPGYDGCEEVQAFERWASGEDSEADASPETGMHVLRVGDVISYRIVEVSAAGYPQVSPRRRGVVSFFSSDNDAVMLLPHPDAARLGGLASAARCTGAGDQYSCIDDATRRCISSPYSPDGTLQVARYQLLCVKLLCSSDIVLPAAALMPDAAATLSASAAALAAARRMTGIERLHALGHAEQTELVQLADVPPSGGEARNAAATFSHAPVAVPAATPRATRAAMRGGGVAGALARLRREAADAAA